MSPADPSSSSRRRVGYVLKMYPRFSETFIVTEILAREAAGTEVEIFSLRAPVDPRFHPALGAVRAPVTWVPHQRRVVDTWDALRQAHERLPGLTDALPALLAAEPDDAAQALRVAVAVDERRLTHLHAHFASVATTVARLAARLAGVTYSFTAHAKDIFHDDVDVDELRAKVVDAHHVVTVTEYNRAHLRERLGDAATSRLHCVYNGLDLDAFSTAPRDPDAGAHIVAVGRLVEKKGFDVLIDACATLVERGRDIVCDIIGGGLQEGDLRDQIRRLRLDDVVRLRGPLPQDEVRRRVGAGTMLVAPCVVGGDGNRDGLPTVLLEAMALGTPCVATPVTGIPEAIIDGRTGLLVPERDAVATADAVARIIDDGNLARSLASAARALAEDRFDVTRQAARLDGLMPTSAAPPPRAVAPDPAPLVEAVG